MSTQEEGRSKDYQDARNSFDGLGAEEKAAFLVDSAFSMLARGVNQASEVVSNAIDEIVEEIKRCRDEEEAATEEPVAEAEEQKPPAKKKTTRKRPTRKTPKPDSEDSEA